MVTQVMYSQVKSMHFWRNIQCIMPSIHSSAVELASVSLFSSHVLARYQVDIHSPVPISQLSANGQANAQLVVDLSCANTKSREENIAAFQQFSVLEICDYLQKTHEDYLTKRLPELEQTMEIFLAGEQVPLLLQYLVKHSFRKYETTMRAHIMQEEATLFPYAKALATGSKPKTDFSSKVFSEQHQAEGISIMVIEDTVKQHCAGSAQSSPYRLFMQKLSAFKDDIMVHEILEDQVLVPKLQELEGRL